MKNIIKTILTLIILLTLTLPFSAEQPETMYEITESIVSETDLIIEESKPPEYSSVSWTILGIFVIGSLAAFITIIKKRG